MNSIPDWSTLCRSQIGSPAPSCQHTTREPPLVIVSLGRLGLVLDLTYPNWPSLLELPIFDTLCDSAFWGIFETRLWLESRSNTSEISPPWLLQNAFDTVYTSLRARRLTPRPCHLFDDTSSTREALSQLDCFLRDPSRGAGRRHDRCRGTSTGQSPAYAIRHHCW